MHHHAELHEGLRENLCALLNRRHTHRQLNSVVAVCHALASAFLKSKRAGWALTNIHAFSYSDLAYDCIADLFHKGDDDNYLQWKAYFEGIPLAELPDEEILAHVRRLVFNKVNHGIFRIFNDLDPSLGKVLRNVKLAIQTLNNFVEMDRFGETHIAPSLCETLEHLPAIDREALEQVLIEARNSATHIPDILARLSLYLRQQSVHSRLVPMTLVATVIRKLYIPDQQTHTEPGMETQFTLAETSETIRNACSKVKEEMSHSYVGRKKVTAEMFDTYFLVVEENILQRFIGTDGDESSLLDQLRVHIPDLTKEEYKKHHRPRLEYLARMAHDEALTQLRKHHK